MNKFKYGLLGAVAAGALVMGTSGVANASAASTILFAPGVFDGGTADFENFFDFPDDEALLDAKTPVSLFSWAARNDTLTDDGTDATNLDLNASEWFVRIFDTGGAGSDFTESFTFHLSSAVEDVNTFLGQQGNGQTFGYGDLGGAILGEATATHVVMQASLGGTVTSIGGSPLDISGAPVDLTLKYESAFFSWFFDPDGKAAGSAPDGPEDWVLIATAGGTLADGGLISGAGTPNASNIRLDLSWLTTLNCVLPGTFFNNSTGDDLANGDSTGCGGLEQAEGSIVQKFTTQNVTLSELALDDVLGGDASIAGATRLIIFNGAEGATGLTTLQFVPVPEPATLGLLGAGLFGLGAIARRRRSA